MIAGSEGMKAGLDALETRNVARYVGAAAVLLAAIIAFFASGRRYLGFGVESDLLMQFLPEAERFLNGEPLELPYHPPLYAVVLAAAKLVTGDWLTGGFAISVCAGAVSIFLGYRWFRLLGGASVGLGAAAGMLASSAFVAHMGLASSDVLFLALFLGVGCLAAAAGRKSSTTLWLASGVVAGLAILTRTNGITLLAAVLLPWLDPDGKERLRSSGAVLGGAAAVLGSWSLVALLSDSSVAPDGTYVSLAWYYYRRDLLFDDAQALLSTEFHSLWDVVGRDPLRILSLYVRDFYDLLQQLLTIDFTLNSPVNLLVLPGLVYLAATQRLILQHLVVFIVPQLLLLNLAVPDQRYYLVLTPVFGAGAMGTLLLLLSVVRPRWPRVAVAAFFSACWLFAAVSALRGAERTWEAGQSELARTIEEVKAVAGEDTLLVARKPHASHYTGLRHAWVPPSVQSESQLEDWLESIGADDVLLYVGSEEVRVRPNLARLLTEDGVPSWMSTIAKGDGPPPWALFRYRPRDRSSDGLEPGGG